jgi:hypothetical protein
MPITLRILLIAGAVLTLAFFCLQIRKKRLQIDYAIFWSLFSAFLVLIAVFPDIVIWCAETLGFASPANLVFLVIMFFLVLRLFSLTLKLSKLNQQVETLTQKLAIHETDHGEKTECREQAQS